MVDMLDALESGVSHDDGYDECDYFSLDDYDEFRDGLTPEWREVFPALPDNWVGSDAEIRIYW